MFHAAPRWRHVSDKRTPWPVPFFSLSGAIAGQKGSNMNKYYRIALMTTMMGATALPALAQTTAAATPTAMASKPTAPVKKTVHHAHHAKVAPKLAAKGK